MLSSTPPLPTQTTIWQQKRHQLVERLAAKGIHISEDDPRLAQPSASEPSPDDGRFVQSSNIDSGSELPRQASPLPMRSKPERRIDFGSPANAGQAGESLLFGQDPASEARRRRELQEATRQQLQQQIMDKKQRLEVERIQRRMQLLSQTGERQLPAANRSDAKPTTPPPSLPSVVQIGSDPFIERQRRRQMQAEMNKILQQQIREKAMMERMAQSSTSNDFSTSTRSPFVNNFSTLSPHRGYSPSPEIPARPTMSLAALDRDPEEEVIRRRKSQADLNSFLRLQMQEQQNRRSSERGIASQKVDGSPFASNAGRRQRLRESSDLYSNQKLSDFSVRTPRPSPGIGSLLFADRSDSPDTIRQRKREYAEALQNQMLRSPEIPDLLHAPAKLAGNPHSQSSLGNGLPFGEKVQTPEILRQKQRDYAEALQLQMIERRQRQLRQKTQQDEADSRYDPSESTLSQTRAVFSDVSVLGDECSSPSRALESQPSQINPPYLSQSAFSSPGSASTPSIFDHDPVKTAISQKMQRKQLGEELQRQMDEQRKRKEEFKHKEQQENQEYHNRVLKQIEEMNRACTKPGASRLQQQRNQVESGETGSSSRQEESFSEPQREEPDIKPPQEQRTLQSRLRNSKLTEMKDPVEPERKYSPVYSGASLSGVDWTQTEAQVIRPLRELRNKLSLGSEELRQRIAQQRQKIKGSQLKPDLGDHTSSLPNTSSWLPVELESEGQLPVQSEFVNVPDVTSDEDTLERFVNDSEVPPPHACGSASKRRYLWGTPVFPSVMPTDHTCEGRDSKQMM